MPITLNAYRRMRIKFYSVKRENGNLKLTYTEKYEFDNAKLQLRFYRILV